MDCCSKQGTSISRAAGENEPTDPNSPHDAVEREEGRFADVAPLAAEVRLATVLQRRKEGDEAVHCDCEEPATKDPHLVKMQPRYMYVYQKHIVRM